MPRAPRSDRNKTRLRLWLVLFLLALAVPTGFLIYQAYSQLKWETFHQYQLLAEELTERIDGRFKDLIEDEESRSFADYGFLVVAGDPSASFLQRSPLSAYPVSSTVPGLIGFFQVDAEGTFSTPLVPREGADPASYGIDRPELEQRLALQGRIQQILSENRLVQAGPAEAPPTKRAPTAAPAGSALRRDRGRELEAASVGALSDMAEGLASEEAVSTSGEADLVSQMAFDRLNAPRAEQAPERKREAASKLGRVEDLQLDYRYQATPAPAKPGRQLAGKAAPSEKRMARKERSALPEPQASALDEAAETETPERPPLRISIFESEVDPFELSLLDSGHFVLFRKVWRDGQRYIQGALIEQEPFLRELIESALSETTLARMSDLVVAYQGRVLSLFGSRATREYLSSAEDLRGALLYQTRLSAPWSGLELLFSVTRLPPGPGASVITWLAAILLVVLVGGFYLMYRLGLRQIALARQQQDFVSAVSHELKTPLTSIRMYGEILREGWASEEKKRIYYDYIFAESERLSRLITNVLQLARMTRNELRVELAPVSAAELMDGIRSKVSTQTERAGFALSLDCAGAAAEATIQVDADAFAQILINLVDNAIKFSAKAERKAVDIGCRLSGKRALVLTVRDYGPGIAKDQMKKIFRLFYRSENELTRETMGTGIGLALVHRLAQAMNAKVDLVNREPGAEFSVTFPLARTGSA